MITKAKLITIITTSLLLVGAVLVHFIIEHRIIYENNPLVPIIMLVSTAIYVFGGCMLQTFKHFNASLALGMAAYFMLSVCLFYSDSILDFLVFLVCITCCIRKTNKVCNDLGDCKNPLR